MAKKTSVDRIRLTTENAYGGSLWGQNVEHTSPKIYGRRDFTDPTSPRFAEVDWFLKTKVVVETHIAKRYLPLQIGISEIQVWDRIYFDPPGGAKSQLRLAAVTYMAGRKLFITPAGIRSSLTRFEEVAHSLDFNQRFGELRSPSVLEEDDISSDMQFEWWLKRFYEQADGNPDRKVAVPLRCHLAIYDAFLAFVSGSVATTRWEAGNAQKLKDQLNMNDCRDQSGAGSCPCFHL